MAFRRQFIVLALPVAVLLVAVACSEVDRTVTDRRIDVDLLNGATRVVVWESDRYAEYTVRRAPCWDEATVGAPVPDSCLTARILSGETNPVRRAPWLTIGFSAFAIAGLVWIALRRITWLPFVERTTAGQPLPRHLRSPDAIHLTHAARREQVAAAARPKHPRRYLGIPLIAGLLVPPLILPLPVVVVGFGTALGWGLVLGIVLLLGVFAAAVAGFTPWSPAPSRGEPYLARLAFLGGAGVGLFATAAVGLQQRGLLLELNGLLGTG